MVEDNTNSANPAPRRRRLFGSRRASAPVAASTGAPAETPTTDAAAPAVEAVAAPVAEAPVAETPDTAETPVAGEPVTAENEAPVAETPAAKAPAKRTRKPAAKAAAKHVNADQAAQLPDTPATDEEEPAAEQRPTFEPPAAGRASTTLIFHAPPALPTPAAAPARGPQAGGPQAGGQQPATDDADAPAGSVRRRNRRRSGDAQREGDDDPNTVVRVREPKQAPLITEPQRIKGSTRLEAKKQRRRDGRDAGRRRTVITESEFLARREAVDRVMVVRSKYDRIQIGVLEDGVLVEHYVAKNQDMSLIGNVYLGRVQNVLPSMEAAFVDIGRGRNAVLYSGEVDWDAVETNNQPRRIELALKPGDKVLVQVTKDPVGHKGARLTSQVSLPGRYLVYVPNGSMNGISRKLPDTERARLKKILKEVLPANTGVIVRTAAEGATEEQLTLDVQRLANQWEEISRLVESAQAPQLLHSEPDLLVKIIRDVFNEDFHKLVVDGADARGAIERYLGAVAPDLLERVEAHAGDRDPFEQYRISEQLEKALDRKVWLPSGGSLVIDRTEAMTVVDVNTGKFVGSGGNLEETVTKNNLEAAEEIVRQLRLRDIGGIIVVDFIDMVLESNRDLVLRRLMECLSRDRTKHQVAEVTSLGLVQMTRKKLGLGLLETFSEPCEVCAGRGIIVHHEPVMKHRAVQAEPGQGRRSRGKGSGNGGGQPAASAPKAPANGGTHAITDDVRNALSKIAASTVPQPATEAAAPEQTAAVAVVEETVTVTDAAPAADRAPAAEPAAAELRGVIELPVSATPRKRRTSVAPKEAEDLLGSVLNALPEPKAPGQGRGRRRAGSAGAVVSAKPTED
ncbi:Rne/Rng family ribonuclease [Galbitalea sp. SE-J8]|uniref:Rne/Rng family ribonuclease n=1 Tax=Galbitalea sp. SE-J8 TaxID=3054952 RepID=UPI00259CDDB3|nr:Rne/Rng family ribonuclease [Galbitalea sp. SE-J8]MDM4761692.1 Rne/Rng family ribonuclease [Galbitalea sp. SE-J8]